MNARLHGFLEFLDLLAEGDRRRAELIAGRSLEPQLQPAVQSARVLKFPLTGHQKARLFEDAPKAKVTTVN
jgi:hypothetical protein